MGCFGFHSSKTRTTMNTSSSAQLSRGNPETRNHNEEILLQIPACRVHLMDEGVAVELSHGEFTLLRIFDQDVSLATIVKVGDDLQWPLTKDEPVVKLDSLSYLFSLPMKDGDPLSYGVSFPEYCGDSLDLLDSFLKEHSCFTGLTSAAAKKSKGVDWKEFAPRVEDYNNFLAKAIAEGTGQIVRGIFKCSNAYANQVRFNLVLFMLEYYLKSLDICLHTPSYHIWFWYEFGVVERSPL